MKLTKIHRALQSDLRETVVYKKCNQDILANYRIKYFTKVCILVFIE